MSIVLVAESHRHHRAMYARYFDRCGFQVVTAANGVECAAKLRRFAPDVVILDSELLWGGAEGVLAVMRDDPGLADIPVVITAPLESPPFIRPASPPIAGVLVKPFALDAFGFISRLSGARHEDRGAVVRVGTDRLGGPSSEKIHATPENSGRQLTPSAGRPDIYFYSEAGRR